MPISVACACGVRLKTKDENAGRSLPCPKCGQTIRIPSDGSRVARPAAAAPPKAAAAEPAPKDVYGFDDLPSAAASATAAAEPGGRSSGADQEKLPPRAGYTPMTEAKKKKIAKRAAKVEKSKPSFAGAGVGASFGVVLLVALFGWRIYRVTHRVGRVIHAVNAAANADPAAVQKEIEAEANRAIEEMVKDPSTAEAREWLDPAKHPNHVVFEMGSKRAKAMVEGFYQRGAEAVYVLEPSKEDNVVVTALFGVKLPAEPAKRQACLAWEVQFLEGEDPTEDTGQKYLMIPTD